MLSTLSRNLFSGSKRLEDVLWPLLVFAFPLIFWGAGYDSFHEPKWLLLTAWVGMMVLLRVREDSSLLKKGVPVDSRFRGNDETGETIWKSSFPRKRESTESPQLRVFQPAGKLLLADTAPLSLPLLVCLGVTFLSLRWAAPDRWVAFALWFRLPVIFLLLHLLVSWIRSKDEVERESSITLLLSMAIAGGCAVASLAILQDWGWWRWGNEPVSDWRFNLSSTLGNPNEVGGYICYLMPVVLARWFSVPPHRPATLLFWGLVGLLLLYGLTTVFTVGAWLGLFLVLPLSVAFIPSMAGPPWRRVMLAVGVSVFVFLLLRLTLSESLLLASHTALFMGVIAILLITVFLLARKFIPVLRWRATLAVAGLLVVWGILLPPWGIANHPDGLVSEALASPRWKGGFGARRFIWTTTALMIKDHPLAGIGWGHYFTVHNLYQGELYRQRGLPHDRPSVGLVPQAHSDPLQVIAESGFLGGTAFFWLVGATVLLWVKRLRALQRGSAPIQLAPELNSGAGAICGSCTPTQPSSAMASGGVQLHQKGSAHECNSWASLQSWETTRMTANLWACGAGLFLIFFHSLVDFPFRQPQPVLLAVVYLAVLISCPFRQTAITHTPERNRRWWVSVPATLLGLVFVLVSAMGLRDQRLLKQGYEGFMRGMTTTNPELRAAFLQLAGRQLDSILYPLPDTHDRWLYRAQVALQEKDLPTAEQALLKAGNYRHTLALYEAWLEFGKQKEDPKVSLGAIQGLILYNPSWASYHDEEASLLRILGRPDEAKKAEQTATRFRVPEKPGP